jgi:hypothetical protein
MFNHSVIQIYFCILSFRQTFAKPKFRLTSPLRTKRRLQGYWILHTLHTISFSRFIYFACLDTSFLLQRDYIPFGSDQIFFDIFYRYNFNSCISNFMFHKSSPVLIFLRFAFIQLQIVFLSLFIFYPQFHQIQHNFTGIHFANNTRLSHYHISNYTLWSITFRDYCGIKLLLGHQYGHYLYINLKKP